ncbi:VOC family protein [Flaviaesturariibacter amylovorans]|uniref:VOC family protein n=1 Tax=Flaviaesturariibacter amylovorans TaxID=1084520 RepID=A0ABP8HP99_9BACT
MPQITPFLWFNGHAEEAATFYTSVFPNSAIGPISRPDPAGPALVVPFSLDGKAFLALNGGPQYTFTEATSFVISCNTQQEIDHYWNALTEGGTPSRCGWLKDRYGLSWQVVPAQMGALMSDPDPAKAQRVMAAMMQMDKLDIAALEAAKAGTTEAV